MHNSIKKETCPTCRWLISGTTKYIKDHKNKCLKNKLERIHPSIAMKHNYKTRSHSESDIPFKDVLENNTCDIEQDNTERTIPMLCEQDGDNFNISDSVDYSEYNNNSLVPHLQSIASSSIITPLQESINIYQNNTETEPCPKQTPSVIDVRRQYSYEDEHIKANMDIFSLMVKGGGSKTLYDAVISRVNKFTSGYLPQLYSYHKSREALRTTYGVEPVTFDVCQKGCMMFKDGDDSRECCHCHSPRYKTEKEIANETMIYLPLKGQLATFMLFIYIIFL
ncbi:hypothetical protein INT45_012599 [Circinella minor]|uniref:Uncharacterized protein n=1 Tax=Circinella minor TaxID=1195481 RepID=A0A8H7RLE3_9FUNG|nr:hypothetical protein INT45_012599 [Circinella minor]